MEKTKNKKRLRDYDKKKTPKMEEEVEIDDEEIDNDEEHTPHGDDEFYFDENGDRKLNLPKKSKYRMRAHCNPLAEISIPYPITPKYVDWSEHFPKILGKSDKENCEIYNNTKKFPIKYIFDDVEESSNCYTGMKNKGANILDVGCGYGGLLFNMSPHLAEGDLALGMEIRDKVANFVSERIKILRCNSNHTKVSIIYVIYFC